MARLTRRLAGDDRGQLLLIGALALAVLFVALAFVLNGAAITEHLATTDDSTQVGPDALRFQHSVERGVGGLIVAVNRRNDTSVSDLDTAMTDAVAEWDDAAARGNAEAGTGTSVSLTGRTYGSRIRQETARNFTDANATDDWTLASSVTQTRDFELNVSRAALSTSCGVGCFRVIATDGVDTWQASVTGNATAILVAVNGPTGSDSCSVTAETATVDLSAGTLAGDPCGWPTFATGLPGPYNVSYENGSLSNGTYTLVVDTGVANDSRYTPGEPSVSPAIYDVDVSLTYRTPQLTYAADIRVVPGATDG